MDTAAKAELLIEMDKAYQGLRDDGTWEQFMASSPEDATPEATGYQKVEPIDENSRI